MAFPCRHLLPVFIIGICLGLPCAAYGQQVSAQFNFTLETLPQAQREDMRNFSRDLKDYVEGWDWINENLNNPVPVFVEGPLAYQGSIIKTRYGSKLTASNGLDIKYLDRWWFFEFEREDQFQHDERRFHSVTWLIDFYVHIMIGHELDKYSEFGGENHFRRAQAISMEGRFDQYFQRGWDERLILVEGLLSDDYKPHRQIRLDFYQGLENQNNNNNPEAKILCRQAVENLKAQYAKNPRDGHVKSFLDAHFIELADIFKTETSPDVYDELIALDPEHSSTYNEYKDNLGQH